MTDTQLHSRIVVGVYGSAGSAAAMRWALHEARLRHARIHLVCACYRDARLRASYAPSSWVTRQDDPYAAVRALFSAAADLARRYLPPGRLTTELVDESPARALLDRCADAEMLVLGTGRPALRPGQPSPAMGPVARACLRLAPCPVVVVGSGHQLAAPGTDPRDRPPADVPIMAAPATS